MKQKISSKQMVFSVTAFIVASSLLTKVLYTYLKQDAWIGVLLGYLISLPVIWIYNALTKRFPSKHLTEINDAVFGRIFGKFISACYVFYFLSLACLNSHDLGYFVKSVILPQTPMVITLTMFIAICAWALRKGITGLTGCSTFLAVISIAFILFNMFLLYNQMDLNNFIPAFTMTLKNYFIGAHLVAALPCCEIFVFFMLVPHMQKPEEFGKALSVGLTIGTAVLLIIVARDIVVLGSYIVVSAMPSFSVLRLINVGDILTRLEIVYAVILISLSFFKISIIYYASVSSFSRLMNFKSDHFLILVFGALITIYAMAVFETSFEHMAWKSSAAAIYSTFFLLILPAATLIVAVIRKIPSKEKTDPA